MRVVFALGGNALLKRDERLSSQVQKSNVRVAGQAIADVAAHHSVIVTHGNGPQVGLLAMRAQWGSIDVARSLDVIGAETEGMIGYLLEQELMNRLPDTEIATILTQVEVDADDPRLQRPTKPIGPVVDESAADNLAERLGWVMGPDGDGFRRLVASPEPTGICQLRTIRRLVDAGVMVVCAGGGGIPVMRDDDGRIVGVDAVIDKDRTSGLLAKELSADLLLLLTDVDHVYHAYGTPEQRPLTALSLDEIERMGLDEGSMGPKVRAAADFVRATGKQAAIGALERAAEVVAGTSGTRVVERREEAS